MSYGNGEETPDEDAQTSAPVSLRRVGVSQGVSLNRGVAGRWAGVARAMLIVIITLCCIIPSLWLGVDAQLKLGAGGGMIALVVVLVFLAPISFLAARALGSTGNRMAAVGAVAFGVLLFTFNLVNAVGSVSVSRATTSDTRGVAITAAQSRDRRNSEIEREASQLQKTSQGDTPDMIRAAVRKLRADPIYTRSRKCEEGFVSKPDSKELCGQIAGHEARLAAAVRIDELRAEQKRFWEPNAEETATSSSSERDPQVATIRAWLGMVSGRFDTSIDSFISAGLIGFAALMAEVAGAFGPSIALVFTEFYAVGRRLEIDAAFEGAKADIPAMSVATAPVEVSGNSRRARKLLTSPKKAKPRNGGTIVPPTDERDATAEDVAAWTKDRLTPRAGSSVKAGILQQDFAAWASERGIVMPNNWPNRFGAIMGDLGYEKVKARYVQYQGLALKGAVLSVVAG